MEGDEKLDTLEDEVLDEIVESEDTDLLNESEEETDLQEDTVPLKTHLELKRQNKDFKRRLAELEKVTYSSEIRDYKARIKQEYIEAGYEEPFAELQSKHLAETREIALIKKTSSIEDDVSDEIDELAESDEFYSDAINFKDQIVKKIKDFKSKDIDLNVEDAYVLVRNVRTRYKEVKTNRDQRDKIRSKNTGIKGTNLPTASGGKVTPKYKLDADDIKALKGLQKMQPDKNWTPEKYYNSKL
jgi:hypothetical protein